MENALASSLKELANVIQFKPDGLLQLEAGKHKEATEFFHEERFDQKEECLIEQTFYHGRID